MRERVLQSVESYLKIKGYKNIRLNDDSKGEPVKLSHGDVEIIPDASARHFGEAEYFILTGFTEDIDLNEEKERMLRICKAVGEGDGSVTFVTPQSDVKNLREWFDDKGQEVRLLGVNETRQKH